MATEPTSYPATTGTRREKGDLCDYVQKLGCVVSWAEGDSSTKLWTWEHPEYKCVDLWEDAEDCAQAFMTLLMQKLAYELSMSLVPRDAMFEVKFALNRAANCPALIDRQKAEKALAIVDKALAC